MATIKSGTYLGIFTDSEGQTFQTYAVAFGNSPKLYPATKYKGGWVVRSRNFVLAAATMFTQAAGLVDADMAVLEASAGSDVGGFLPPTGFVTPTGYTETFDTNGRVYYVPTNSASEDTNGDGVVDAGDTSTTIRSANVFTQVWDWMKANPFLAGAIVLGIVVLYQSMTQKGKGRRKKILGLI